LQILYDKAERRIEISATVSEAIAKAFDNKKPLPKEGSLVVLRDIAGPDSFLATTARVFGRPVGTPARESSLPLSRDSDSAAPCRAKCRFAWKSAA
jgi:hypothetical protein